MSIPTNINVPGTQGAYSGGRTNLYRPNNSSSLHVLRGELQQVKSGAEKAITNLNRIAHEDIPASEVAVNVLNQLNPAFKNWVDAESGLVLRSILPEDHIVFTEFEINKNLEKSRPHALKQIQNMRDLAESQRKYGKNTRNWLKHSSPFMNTDFSDKLTNEIWTKNLLPLLDEPCSRKEVICCTCGSVVRVFIDIEGKVEYIIEQLQIYRIVCDHLDRYDSAMANWERDDKVEKAKAAKIRKEKKLQADIEELEAQRRSAEEKLRKLKGE